MSSIPSTTSGQVPRWTLADRLRKAREHAGLTQAELATAVGCGRRSASNVRPGYFGGRAFVHPQGEEA